MYHISIKRQIIRLSNVMNNIRMDKKKKIWKLQNRFFPLNLLASDISLKVRQHRSRGDGGYSSIAR